MEINIWVLILIILTITVISPFLGRIFYKMDNKRVFLFYFIISTGVTVLIYLLTDHPGWSSAEANIGEYFQNLIRFRTAYVFSFLTYIIGGFGIIGGTLEYAGEQTESAEAYKKYKRSAPIILYFSYLIYGYIFLFAVYSFSRFLTLFFQWEYSANLTEVESFFANMQFHNSIFVGVGFLLFTIKAFRFGVFSIEFYRSEFHPSVADLGPIRKEIRRNFACILGAMGLFVSVWVYIIENFPTGVEENIAFGKSFYYLAATLQAIIFYLLKDRFVDQLKPLAKQFEIKVGTGPIRTDIKDPLDDVKNELRYDDD